MFALTQKRFDAWVHVHDPLISWEQIHNIRIQNQWDTVYVSLYAPQSWTLPVPAWAIAVPSGPLHTLLNTTQPLAFFDASIDVLDGPQRCEDINFPHQIRLLTSESPRDLELTRRFIKASAFSPHLWRLTLEDRLTRDPLYAAAFKPKDCPLTLLGKQEFLTAEAVGLEYVLSPTSFRPVIRE